MPRAWYAATVSAVGILVLALVAAAPPGGSAKERGPGFAFGAVGGLSYTLYPRPSGDVAMYVGVALPATARRKVGRQHLALGYRGELSFGGAEFAPGSAVHRHHLALMGFMGARRRVLLGGGAGVKVTFGGGVGVEAAGQVGYAVVRREHGSLVVGGQLRLGSWLCDGCGAGSYPHFGVFAGWLRLPSRLAPIRDPPPTWSPTPRGFVVGATLGLNSGVLYGLPSGELALFLGARPKRHSVRPGHWLAIGYKGAVGYGFADILTVDDGWPYTTATLFMHRHHVAVQGVAGRRGRLFFGASAGLVVALFRGSTSDENGFRVGSGFGVEGEGRLGRQFGGGDSKLRGVFGGQLRLTKMFGSGAPLPTLGFFIGVVATSATTGPRRRSRPSAPTGAPEAQADEHASSR